MNEEKQTDSEWLREQRLESDRRAWAWQRLKSLGGWTVGALTALWAGIDAIHKFLEWIKIK
jgi:hypothetical protein